jgi:stage V sporulation protein B
MLLPSISADHQKHDKKHMMRTISLTTYGGFFMGLCFLSIFFLFGPWLGRVIFHSAAAGEYLKMLSFLCPALYLSTIFTSILNGMGKTKETFFHNIISILIRLLFIYLAIPKFGIDGYIWGLLISTFALVILNYLEIQKEI